AERPLIVSGPGVMLSGAEREILLLAEKARIPSALTLLGIGGVPPHHPLNLGMMGMHAEAWVNAAIQEADLLIALGMRFDDRVTGNLRTYALNAKKIHVDIDRAELNKNVKVDVAIAKDLRGAIAEWLPKIAPNARQPWHDRINELKGDSAVRDIQSLPDDGHLYAAHVVNDGFLGMVRQWQEFFYQKRYAATPITGPDFVKLADAFGIQGKAVDQRSGVESAVQSARRHRGVSLIDFRVEQEDSVYPMVPA